MTEGSAAARRRRQRRRKLALEQPPLQLRSDDVDTVEPATECSEHSSKASGLWKGLLAAFFIFIVTSVAAATLWLLANSSSAGGGSAAAQALEPCATRSNATCEQAQCSYSRYQRQGDDEAEHQLCAWSSHGNNAGCFEANFDGQLWLQATGCHGGYTNQRQSLDSLLQLVAAMLPHVEHGQQLVLVMPTVWRAVYPPFASGQHDGSVDGGQEPLHQLFDEAAAAQYLLAAAEKAGTSLRIVSKAPPWLRAAPLWPQANNALTPEARQWLKEAATSSDSAAAATRYEEAVGVAVSLPCGGVPGTSFAELAAHAVTMLPRAAGMRRALAVPCMKSCFPEGVRNGWEFDDHALTRATMPAPRLVRIANQLRQSLLVGKGAVAGLHLRLEADMCGEARPHVTDAFEPHANHMCAFTPDVIERCMLHYGKKLALVPTSSQHVTVGCSTTGCGNSSTSAVLYVATGPEVVNSRTFQEWKARSAYEVVTKYDTGMELELGREELAAVDGLVLQDSVTHNGCFFGAHMSSLTALVHSTLLAQGLGHRVRLYNSDPYCTSLLP